jgi:hypothetical protein
MGYADRLPFPAELGSGKATPIIAIAMEENNVIFIEGLPENTVAVGASGKVTHQDYRDTIIPKAERRIRGISAPPSQMVKWWPHVR